MASGSTPVSRSVPASYSYRAGGMFTPLCGMAWGAEEVSSGVGWSTPMPRSVPATERVRQGSCTAACVRQRRQQQVDCFQVHPCPGRCLWDETTDQSGRMVGQLGEDGRERHAARWHRSQHLCGRSVCRQPAAWQLLQLLAARHGPGVAGHTETLPCPLRSGQQVQAAHPPGS